MAVSNYYILTALTTLEDLGSTPPVTPGALLEDVADDATLTAMLQVIFLSDDLVQRQGYLSGEIKDVSPAVLSPGQVRDEEPLPDYLAVKKSELSNRPAGDELWNRYYHYAMEVAGRTKSDFLYAWVGYEVALRNALAAVRAKALDLTAQEYQVAEELADPDADFSAVLNEWSGAQTPLEGLRILDKARWAWHVQHEGWFSFGNDELAAYAAKLTLSSRWHRLREAEKKSSALPLAHSTPERTNP